MRRIYQAPNSHIEHGQIHTNSWQIALKGYHVHLGWKFRDVEDGGVEGQEDLVPFQSSGSGYPDDFDRHCG